MAAPWDDRHSVVPSKNNGDVHHQFRLYFDSPKELAPDGRTVSPTTRDPAFLDHEKLPEDVGTLNPHPEVPVSPSSPNRMTNSPDSLASSGEQRPVNVESHGQPSKEEDEAEKRRRIREERWSQRFSVSWSQANEKLHSSLRQYFQVPREEESGMVSDRCASDSL